MIFQAMLRQNFVVLFWYTPLTILKLQVLHQMMNDM